MWFKSPVVVICLMALLADSAAASLRCDDSCRDKCTERPKQVSMSWNDYKSKFNKSYNAVDDIWRRDLFQKEQMRVLEHNSKACRTHELGLDFMSDWNSTEFERTLGPVSKPETIREAADCEEDVCDLDLDFDFDFDDDDHCEDECVSPFVTKILQQDKEVPCSVDWRKVPNRVGRVKFQLGCGSCWAFAAVGVLEGQQVARGFTNSLVELSEQQLVDCKKNGDGCNGGFSEEALDQVAVDGIMSEKDYPYSRNGSAKCRFDAKKSVMKVKGHAKLPKEDEDTLATVVAHYGPVAISMDLKPLRGYRSGIITMADCECGKIANHEALIVGYGKENGIDYWIVKNSWSADWSDAGYFRIERGKGLCGIDREPIIATF